jgi:hypothetical protein
MAIRRVVAVAVVVAVLAIACSAASAAMSPKQSTPGDPKKLPPGAKYITVTPSRFHKRNYEVTCRTDWGASCLLKCPARCPNKCLAYCAYCLTFCREYTLCF